MGNLSFTIACFGEVLWDVYPDHKQLGGAPFNVAAHLKRLGQAASILSAVGDDSEGKEILQRVEKEGISQDCIQINKYPTGQVLVVLNEEGIPAYEIQAPVAWDFIQCRDIDLVAVQQADAFLFGTLASRTATTCASLKSLLPIAQQRVFDLNLRQSFYTFEFIESLLPHTDILKINDDEFSYLASQLKVPAKKLYEKLHQHFGLKTIIQTKGAEGAEVSHAGNLFAHGGFTVDVQDTVGSGDAFLAGFLAKHLNGTPTQDALTYACGLGALIATKKGAIPVYDPSEIDEIINN